MPSVFQSIRPILHGSPQDFDIIQRLDAEAFELHCQKYTYYPLDIVASEADPLTGDAVKRKYMEPVSMPLYIEFNPLAEDLTRFGIVETRDIVILFSQRIVKEVFEASYGDLNTVPKSGDVVVIDDREFEIVDSHRTSFWANTQKFVHRVATADIRHPHSTVDDRADKTRAGVSDENKPPTISGPEIPFDIDEDVIIDIGE